MRRTLIAPLVAIATLALASGATSAVQPLWGTTFGSTGLDLVRKVVTLDDGSTIVTGGFTGTVSFGSTTLVSTGSVDAFFARMNPDGTWAWAKRAGGAGDDQGRDITVGADGKVVVSGYINQQGIVAASPTFGATTVTAKGKGDFFMTALDPTTGAFAWTRLDGSVAGNDYTYTVRTEPDGSYLTAGSYQSTMTVGGTTLPTAVGNGDLFAMQVNADGTLRWVRYLGGGTGFDDLFGLTILSDGSFAAAGYVGMPATFNNGTTVTPAGAQDIVVLKADPTGTVEWVRQGGGAAGDDFGLSISAYPDDSLLVGGYFKGAATIGGTAVTSAGGQDGFIAKYSSQGTPQWVRTIGSTGDEYVWQVRAVIDGTGWVSGYYANGAHIGALTLTSAGGLDGMALQLDADGNVTWSATRGGPLDDQVASIAIGANGMVSFGGRFKGTATIGGHSVTSAGDYDGFVESLQAERPVAPTPRNQDPAPAPEPAPAPVVVDTTPADEPVATLAAAPARVALTGRVRTRGGLVITWGPVPTGVDDVVQAAAPARSAAAASVGWGSPVSYPCTVTGFATARRYQCARALGRGTWRLTTEARTGTTMVGRMVSRVAVRATRATPVTG